MGRPDYKNGNDNYEVVTPNANTKDITHIYYVLDSKALNKKAYTMHKNMERIYRDMHITIKGGFSKKVVKVTSEGYSEEITNLSGLDGFINKIKLINQLESDGFIKYGASIIELRKEEITILFFGMPGILISNASNGDILDMINNQMLKETPEELKEQVYTAIKKAENKIKTKQDLHNLELGVRGNTERNEQYDEIIDLLKKNGYTEKQSDKVSFNSGFIKGTVLSTYIKWTTKVYIVKVSEHKLIILTKQGNNNRYSFYSSVQDFINDR